MLEKTINAGIGHIPTTEIENRATVITYDTRPYINAGSHDDELQQLRNEQVIRDFANIKPDTYELIKATQPVLLMMVNLAKKIMEAE